MKNLLTFKDYEHVCSTCNNISKHPTFLSGTLFRIKRALDGRFLGDEKHLFYLDLVQCPYCNHIAPNLAEKDNLLLANDFEKKYFDEILNEINIKEYPANAQKFIYYATYQNFSGRLEISAINYLKAAWVCDDCKADALAKKTRKMAIKLYEELITRPISDKDLVHYHLLLIDMYRRNKQFKKANDYLKDCCLIADTDSAINLLLKQKELIDQKDSNCHQL